MLILASASPRRRELLARTGLPFTAVNAEADETPPPGASPCETALALARRKAEAARRFARPGDVVLAADTVVDLDGRALGKPKDESQARAMLAALSGRGHLVHTGFCILCGSRESGAETTAVTFFPLTAEEINRYVATGDRWTRPGPTACRGWALCSCSTWTAISTTSWACRSRAWPGCCGSSPRAAEPPRDAETAANLQFFYCLTLLERV